MEKKFVIVFLLLLLDSNWITASSDIGNAINKKEYNKMLNYIKKYNAKSKDIVETKKLDSGKVYDCVDFYKQPSMIGIDKKTFKFPKPPKSVLKDLISDNSSLNAENNELGDALFSVSCPKNTVGIERFKIKDISKYKTLEEFKKEKYPKYKPTAYEIGEGGGGNWRIHSVISTGQTNIGAASNINIWEHSTLENDEFSLSQIWVMGGQGTTHENRIEIGVVKYHAVDSSRLFFYLSTPSVSGYANTGFTTVDAGSIGVFEPMPDYSVMGGHQAEIKVAIYREQTQGHWWLWVHDRWIGFYNTNLFVNNGLKQHADDIHFGGEITLLGTDMGSGKLPSAGVNNVAYQRNIRYVDETTGAFTPITTATELTKHRDCYNIEFSNSGSNGWNSHIYFGGSAALESTCTSYEDW